MSWCYIRSTVVHVWQSGVVCVIVSADSAPCLCSSSPLLCQAICSWRHPPGNEIYRKDSLSVFEVDGEKHKVGPSMGLLGSSPLPSSHSPSLPSLPSSLLPLPPLTSPLPPYLPPFPLFLPSLPSSLSPLPTSPLPTSPSQPLPSLRSTLRTCA